MNKNKYAFAQMVKLLDNNKFHRIVKKYESNSYVKYLIYWNKLPSLMFGKFCNRKNIRDLIVAFNVHQEKCSLLGV